MTDKLRWPEGSTPHSTMYITQQRFIFPDQSNFYRQANTVLINPPNFQPSKVIHILFLLFTSCFPLQIRISHSTMSTEYWLNVLGPSPPPRSWIRLLPHPDTDWPGTQRLDKKCKVGLQVLNITGSHFFEVSLIYLLTSRHRPNT